MLECRVRGKLRIAGIKNTNTVAVGDSVNCEYADDGTGIINSVEPRKNYIIRKATKLSKQYHIIASNIDQALLLITLVQPKTLTAFIDRFLATAEAYSIPVILVFNKTDICTEKQLSEMEYLEDIYTGVGYRCIKISALTEKNIDAVRVIFKDKTNLIAGNSGTGKSTLINKIEPNLKLKTDKISESHQTGKHTTTFAEMFELSSGGYVIDTPGIKSFGMVDFRKEQLNGYFPEIFRYSAQCRFNNCSHINEPKCAVKEAVENGKIAEFRYVNYCNIYSGDDLVGNR